MENNELLNCTFSINNDVINKKSEFEVNDKNILQIMTLFKKDPKERKLITQKKLLLMSIINYKEFKRYYKNITDPKINSFKKFMRVYNFCSKFIYYIYSNKFLFKKDLNYKELQYKLIEELNNDFSDSRLVYVLYNFVNKNLELAIFPLEITGNYNEIEFFFNMCTMLYICNNYNPINLNHGSMLSSDAKKIKISELNFHFKFSYCDKILFPSILILSSNNDFFQKFSNEFINIFSCLFFTTPMENSSDEEKIIKILEIKNESPQQKFEMSVFLNYYLLNLCLLSDQFTRLFILLTKYYQESNWVIYFEFMKNILNNEKCYSQLNSIPSFNEFLHLFFCSLFNFYSKDQIDLNAKIIIKFSANFLLFIKKFLDLNESFNEEKEKIQKLKLIIFSLYITNHLSDAEIVNKLQLIFNTESIIYKLKEIEKNLHEIQKNNFDESKIYQLLWEKIEIYFSYISDKNSSESISNKSTELTVSFNQNTIISNEMPIKVCETKGHDEIPIKQKINELIQFSKKNNESCEEIYKYIIAKLDQDKTSSNRSIVSVLKIDLKYKVKKIIFSLNSRVLTCYSDLKSKSSSLSLTSFENKFEAILDYYFDNIANEKLSFSHLILKIQICLTWNVINQFLNLEMFEYENNDSTIIINICNFMINNCWKSCFVEIEKIYIFNISKDTSTYNAEAVVESVVSENNNLQQFPIDQSSSYLFMQTNLSSFNRKKDSFSISKSGVDADFIQNNDDEITESATENDIIYEQNSSHNFNNFSQNSESSSKIFDGQSFISSNPIEDSSIGQSFSLKVSSLSKFISLAGYSNLNVKDESEEYFKEKINFVKEKLKKKYINSVSNFENFENVINELFEIKMRIGCNKAYLRKSWDTLLLNGNLYFPLL